MRRGGAPSREEKIGYAVPAEWYKRYQRKERALGKIKNKDLLGEDGKIRKSAEYAKIGPEEWLKIKRLYAYDVEVPIGIVMVKLIYKDKEREEKKFPVEASQKIFEVLQVVLFNHKITVERFNSKYTCTITNNVDLSDTFAKCNTSEVNIAVERRSGGCIDNSSSDSSNNSSSDNNSNNSSNNHHHRRKKEVSKAFNGRPVEFRNLGLSCYMNTALQVLLGVEELSREISKMETSTIMEYGRRKDTKKDYSKEKSANLLLAYKNLVKSTARHEDCSGCLREIKRALGTIDPRYGKYSEEDAGEVFSLILTNLNYLFEKTAHKNLIPELFMYNADQVKVYLNNNREIHREKKNIYRSFVLNGYFGSDKSIHHHVLVIHKDPLHTTALCVHREIGTAYVSVESVKERICRSFNVQLHEIIVCEINEEGKVVRKKDTDVFIPSKNLLEQPIFYLTDTPERDTEFVFVRYTAQKESPGFFGSFFGGADKRTEILPFVIKKKRNITDFLKKELKIKRRIESIDTQLDMLDEVEESERSYASIAVVLSQKHWEAQEYIEALKERKNRLKDHIHMQCLITNWENRAMRKIVDEKDKRADIDADAVVEYTRFSGFSKYFCMQLPSGLGNGCKSDRIGDRSRLYIEKECLVLEGKVYSLWGILVHHTFGIGGHYVAFTKRGETWYHCNDSTITKSSAKEAAGTGYPYGILYRRKK